MNNKIKSLINIFPENMVHFVFLLKLAISRNTTKLVSQFLDLRNRRYDFFARKPKIQILNKRKGGKEVTLTVDPSCQVLLPHG